MEKQNRNDTAKIIGASCLAVRVRMLSRAVSSLYDDALRENGLTISQLNILVVVLNAGRISPSKIGRLLKMERSTVSRTIDRMLKMEWLVGTYSDGVGRLSEVEASKQGEDLLNTIRPQWENAQKQAAALLGDATVEALMKTVDFDSR